MAKTFKVEMLRIAGRVDLLVHLDDTATTEDAIREAYRQITASPEFARRVFDDAQRKTPGQVEYEFMEGRCVVAPPR